MRLKAINCNVYSPASSKDAGSGRCRMTLGTAKALSLSRKALSLSSVFCGSIIKLSLHLPFEKRNDCSQEDDGAHNLEPTSPAAAIKEVRRMLHILCTVWPVYDGDEFGLIDGHLVVDDSVHCLSSNSVSASLQEWAQCECEVIEIMSPQVAASISLQLQGRHPPQAVQQIGMMLNGIAVAAECQLRIRSDPMMNATIKSMRPHGLCVVTPRTLLKFAATVKNTSDEVGKELMKIPNTMIFGSRENNDLSLVEELINRIVKPILCQNRAAAPKGVLLLGPPGVGKTYAVKAMQQQCTDTCTIVIKDLNIVSLLGAVEPLALLEEKLQSIRHLLIKSNLDVTSSVLPTNGYSDITSPSSNQSSKSSTPLKTPDAASLNISSTKKGFSFLSPKTGVGSERSTSSPFHHTPSSTIKRICPPTIHFLIIDEIDALGTQHDQSEVQLLVKQKLLQWMDTEQHESHSHCCVIATSNRDAAVDTRFRRGGRLEMEIQVTNGPADRQRLLFSLLQEARAQLPQSLLGNIEKETEVEHKESRGNPCGVSAESGLPERLTQIIAALSDKDIEAVAQQIASRTGGYVAADLTNLVSTMLSHENWINRCNTCDEKWSGIESSKFEILLELFEAASHIVTPSCLRGATVKLPRNVQLNDIIGYTEVKKKILNVMSQSSAEKQYQQRKFGLIPQIGGILLHGPPGNSKTRLIGACCAHFGLPMISLSTADVYSPYVGDAEAEVRKAFQLARQAAPCVLFLDELDSIVTNRGTAVSSSTTASVEARVLATLLTEMDGIIDVSTAPQKRSSNEASRNSVIDEGSFDHHSASGVIVMGATNRLDFIDAALLRKGRFHHILHVPTPNSDERTQLLYHFATKFSVSMEDIFIYLKKQSNITVVLNQQHKWEPSFQNEFNSINSNDRNDISDNPAAVAALLPAGTSGAEIENLCREVAMSNLHKSIR